MADTLENKTTDEFETPVMETPLPDTSAFERSPQPPKPRKKRKSKRIRLLQRRLIVLAAALGIFLICFSLGALWRGGQGTKLTEETVTAQLASLGTLSKSTYHFTNVERFENVEDFYGWDVSDRSSFTLSYEGTVTAAIDPANIKVELKGKTITVTLPEAAITAQEIAQDSISVLSDGQFKPIELTDFAGFKENQASVIAAKATANQLLFDVSDQSKAAATALIEAMVGGSDKYDIAVK